MIGVNTTDMVLLDIETERLRQNEKWGVQDHPSGTGGDQDVDLAERYRQSCEVAHASGMGTWKHILREEVYEAFAEADPMALRKELVQVAAVAVAWVEALDRGA